MRTRHAANAADVVIRSVTTHFQWVRAKSIRGRCVSSRRQYRVAFVSGVTERQDDDGATAVPVIVGRLAASSDGPAPSFAEVGLKRLESAAIQWQRLRTTDLVVVGRSSQPGNWWALRALGDISQDEVLLAVGGELQSVVRHALERSVFNTIIGSDRQRGPERLMSSRLSAFGTTPLSPESDA